MRARMYMRYTKHSQFQIRISNNTLKMEILAAKRIELISVLFGVLNALRLGGLHNHLPSRCRAGIYSKIEMDSGLFFFY